MKNLIFALFVLLFAPQAFSAGENCSQSSDHLTFKNCIEAAAAEILEIQGNEQLAYHLGDLVRKHKIELSPESIQKSQDMFRISLCKFPTTKIDHDCFRFARIKNKKAFTEALIAQIKEVVSFLAYFQARSLGHRSSLLFQIVDVSLVPQFAMKHERNMAFTDSTLYLGLNFQNAWRDYFEPLEVYSSDDLLTLWNSGNQIRSRDAIFKIFSRSGMVRDFYQNNLDLNPEGVLLDKFADKWILLNPIGIVRSRARVLLLRAAQLPVLRGKAKDAQNYLKTIINDKGFGSQKQQSLAKLVRNPRSAEKLYETLRKMSENTANVSMIAEGSQFVKKTGREDLTQLERVQGDALVNVMNHHTVIVDVGSLFSVVDSMERFVATDTAPKSKSTYINKDKQGDATVNVNTSDYITVEVENLFVKSSMVHKILLDQLLEQSSQSSEELEMPVAKP